MWAVFALLSAVFAALTSILAKLGMGELNSNLATAIRTVVVLIMAWAIVFMTGKHHEMGDITARSWLFLVLSGVATGLSWLCYYRALQLGPASKVVPIDKFSVVISMVLAFVVLKEVVYDLPLFFGQGKGHGGTPPSFKLTKSIQRCPQ